MWDISDMLNTLEYQEMVVMGDGSYMAFFGYGTGMERVWNGYGTGMDRGMERNGPEFLKFLADCFGGRFKI